MTFKFKTAIILLGSLLLTSCDNNTSSDNANKTQDYPKQSMMGFNIAYPTSFLMNREETESYFELLPDNVQDITTEMIVYKSKPVCNLSEVRLVYFKMNPIMSYDIDAGAKGIIDNIAALGGMNKINSSIKPLTISDYPGRYILFEGKIANENVSYQGVLIADTEIKRVWQLQFIRSMNSSSDEKKFNQSIECTNKFIDTISIDKEKIEHTIQ
ncbi:hypothetical protein [Proteus myxofaciens]|nr:hypothetical protein [Proteus myxofaciens]